MRKTKLSYFLFFFFYGLTANFRSLSSHASAALKSRWLTTWRKKWNPYVTCIHKCQYQVSNKYQISSHHKVKLIYPAARFTPSPEVRLVGFLDILRKLVPSATWSHLQLASLCCSWGAIELANTHRGVCLPNLDSMLMTSITSYPIFSNKFPAQWQKLLSACVKRCEFYRWHCLPIWYYRTAYVKMTKLLLAYEQMSQSFSVAMPVAMTAYVITFERMGRHAKHHPPSQTVAAKVQSSK